MPVVTVAPRRSSRSSLPRARVSRARRRTGLARRACASRFAWEIAADPVVQRERDWYARNQTYLDRVFKRADLYLFHIVGELEARGMPAELALLPIVESAFDPVRVFARPRGRVCGRSFPAPASGSGSRRTGGSTAAATCSSRRAPRSTISSSCIEQFDGDWLLAVAGYNSGEGNVARALKKAAAAGKPQDFWGIKSYLPAETRTYVPRLLAIAELVGNPGRVRRHAAASCATRRSSPSSKPAARSTWRSRPSSPASTPMRCTR